MDATWLLEIVMLIPPTPDGRLPEYYQQADVETLFRWLAGGESCSAVGVGSVGKSNLLQFLSRDDIRERYLGHERAPYFVMVLLNPYQMIHPQEHALTLTGDAWAGYEIMLSRLRRMLALMLHTDSIPEISSNSDDALDRLTRHYNSLFDPQPLMAQAGIRQLEDALAEALGLDRRMRVVFMFDEFEEFVRLPPYFWQSLRGLRDDYKQRVMYLTASRRPLTSLVDDEIADLKTALEGFLELFSGFRHYVNRLDGPSTRASIERLEQRYGTELSTDLVRILSYTTGRHPGLLRRGFHVAAERQDPEGMSEETFIDLLLQASSIQAECGLIYASLSLNEQRILNNIVHQVTLDIGSAAWLELLAKQLVTQTDDKRPVLTIPVLAMYIRDHLELA